MTIIEYLKTLEPKAYVTIFLREYIELCQDYEVHMIAKTTADMLLKSTKEGFRRLIVHRVVGEESHPVIIVKNPKE